MREQEIIKVYQSTIQTLNDEITQMKMLIWAMIKQNGGQLKIKPSQYPTGSNRIEAYQNNEDKSMVYKAL